MRVDVSLLEILYNDTTTGTWKSSDTKLLISKLNGGYDVYNIQSRGDAAFIAHVHNICQEIIDELTESDLDIDLLSLDDDEFSRAYERGDSETVDRLLEKSVIEALRNGAGY